MSPPRTPGALDVLVSTVQQDLKGQPTGTVLLPKGGHANPDESSTGVAVYQPGGAYQIVSALGLGTNTESQYPAGVGDAFAKLQALTSDATTDGATAAAVRAACAGTDTPAGQPQPAATVYRSAKGPLVCLWRYALPDETS